MVSINSVTLLGSVKGDVRHNVTANSQVANFSLITEGKTMNGNVYSVYHNITAWGQNAETAKAFAEGDIVGITGELRSESWEQNGEKKYKTVVVASRLTTDNGEVF